MADWTWDARSRRYRNTSTGRYLSASASVSLRDDAVTRLQAEAGTLARQLANQSITVQAWEREMQRATREIQTLQWMFGRGGRNAMTEADRSALAALIRDQYTYLRTFAEEIAAGTLSERQISARSKLYHGASRQAYEQGRASAFGISLPAHPCDGSTPCLTQCRCYWSLVDTGETVEATWKRTAVESCRVCKRRASSWAPLVLATSSDGRIARLWRAVA